MAKENYGKKGVWKKYFRLFRKCKIPWIFLIVYLLLSLGFINMGISETDCTAELFSGNVKESLLFKLILIMLVNLVGNNITSFIGNVTSARTNRNMRTALHNKILRLPMSYYEGEEPREAVYRIVSNAVVIDSTIMMVLIPFITQAYSVIAILGEVSTYHLKLAGLLLIMFPVYILMTWIFGKLNFIVSMKQSDLGADLTEKLAELITHIPLAKAFAKENIELEKGKKLTRQIYHMNIKSSWLGQLWDFSETFVAMFEGAIITIVGAMFVNNGEISKKEWIAFFMFSSLFMDSISQITSFWTNLKIIQGNAAQLAEIMYSEEEDEKGVKCEITEAEDILFQHVSFKYENASDNIFDDINLRIDKDKVTAIIGKCGSGKTTLMNILIRLYTPTNGKILIGDKENKEFTLDSFRNKFTIISQNPMIFSGNIRENITYGLEEYENMDKEILDTKVQEKIKECNMERFFNEFISEFSNGLDTKIQEYGNNFSGGQRKKIAIIRAILSNTPYIIFDEPLAAMDMETAEEIIEMIKKVGKINSKCVILISHDSRTIHATDDVVVIDKGRIIDSGNKEEIIKRNKFALGCLGGEV
ncbi:ABC-type bacteriocin/lantibiotic exporter, contains an N-terminal double-glycine peptidase domain [Lachnospiraceae bacterium C7]|nr:ABC-type bacteriocin/lantibiotic exporter, contains an N-terminal double-glycine peptidase domain [Lachnospiraceae bacterium C7]